MSKLVNELGIGDKIRFGSYKVGDNEVSPIIWRIAAKNHPGYPENSVTLLTDRIIDLRPFSKDKLTSYTNSDIRNWLNTVSGFLSHFTTEEFSKILDTNVEIISDDDPCKYKYDELIDKVFLLSLVEIGLIKKGVRLPIFDGSKSFITPLSEQCFKESNCTINKIKIKKDDGWAWWLRCSSEGLLYINHLGYLYDSSSNMFHGVRPALNISNDIPLLFNSPDKDVIYTLETAI